MSIGELVLLCKEIRETLVDLTVENRLDLRIIQNSLTEGEYRFIEETYH